MSRYQRSWRHNHGRRIRRSLDYGRARSGAFIVYTLLLAGIAGMVTLGYGYITRSEFFRIRHMDAVEIHGLRRLSRDEIRGLSGITLNTNIIALDTGRVRAAIESHPWVARARVDRFYPNRVRIRVEERKPFALLNRDDGIYYVDRAGTVFARVMAGDDLDYPVITGLEHDVVGNHALLNRALATINAVRRSDPIFPRQSLSELHVADGGDQTLFLVNNPFPVRLGRAQPRQKEISAVLRQLYKRKVFDVTRMVDLSYGKNQVLVRLAMPVS